MVPVETDPLPGTRLPQEGETPATVLAIPGPVVKQYDVHDVVADAIEAIGPDIIIATPPNSTHVALPPVTRITDIPVVDPSRSASYHAVGGSGVLFAMVPTPDHLPPTPTDVPRETGGSGGFAGLEHCYLVSNCLELTIDPHHRETRLEGIDEYLDSLPDGWLDESLITHVSTGLRAEYQARYETATDTYPIHGAGPPTSSVGAAIDENERPLIELSVYSNGAIRVETHDPTNFGLQGLEGIGPTKAERLRDHGFNSRDAIAGTTPKALAKIRGFGEKTATAVHKSATAIATGEVVPRDGGTLPNGDPVFIDVETNGFNGEIAWLVGVLDGGSEEGHYLPFRQQEHDDPIGHVDAFMSWLTGVAGGRPVVAWNGYGFDFPIIKRHLERDAPEWVDDWESRYQFDPLYYATTQGHATFPARSNRLEAVAAALGWESTTTGVDGGTAAREYNTWQQTANQSDGYQPDWDRLEAYCEDDVRALATVYEALQDASRRPPGTEMPKNRTGEQSRQGSLSDFS
ncbi:ribonuclease H-like domain-containing protein [Natrinema limicola]|uniref:ribonuclease H-like domain-containing protein n=1 Tax=Natrinema limicola TaxID=370323 RepID=UPI0009FC7CFE|nr:ribonuclease H-like domain-containing protein [Natrinema limicola]